MSAADTGGSAFPTENEHQTSASTFHFEGMTLRDYFAAKCCAAMVSTIRNDEDFDRLRLIADGHDLDHVSQFFAQESYKQADAMIAERAK
jgi:hypothetical protein